MVMEVNCASHKSKKFLFLKSVWNPRCGASVFITQSPCVWPSLIPHV